MRRYARHLSIDIINEYTAPGAKPFIDHILNPNPTQQVIDWASDILTPADARGNLLITITRAAMTEEHLEGEESIKGFFTNEQTRKVRIELEAYFSFGHPQNNRSATLTVQAAYETTIAENTTPRDADLIRKAVMEEGWENLMLNSAVSLIWFQAAAGRKSSGARIPVPASPER